MLFFLNPPENETTAKIKREVRDTDSYNYSTKLAIGPKKLKQLENIVKTNYRAWDESYGKVREDLKSLNRLMEGMEDKTDFPFGAESSSQIDLRLPAEKFRSLRANFRRAIFGGPQLISAGIKPGGDMDSGTRNKAEAALNWSISEMCNLSDVLKDSDLPCFRDGTALIYGEFVREVERGVDCKIYTDANEFQSDYPDYKSAGCAEEEYTKILDILLNPTEESEVRVEYELDFVSKNGPSYTLFPLIDFIHFPFYADKVNDLTIYGYTFKEGRNKFLEKRKRNYYYPESVENISDKFDSTTYEDEWDTERDNIEGISSEHKDAYKFARLIVKADLDNDRRVEHYVVTYWPEKERILRVERYRVRRNTPCIVPFKFIGRDGRLSGVSLLKDGRDLFGEINAIHRHRSNRRRLTDSVTIIAPNAMKESLGDNYQFTPGGILWTPDDLFIKGEVPRQFVLQNISDDSRNDESLTIRFLEGLMGPSMGMSGQEDPGDPGAPGNKTAMLLTQANYRVSDYVDEWKRSIPLLMSLHTALLYQNYKSKINFRNMYGEEDVIDSSLLVSDFVKWTLKSNGIPFSPEAEMQKIARVFQGVVGMGGIPFKIDPKTILQMSNDFIIASRIPGWEQYIAKMPTTSPTGNTGNPGNVESSGIPGESNTKPVPETPIQ
jgi:hypothetical protein